MTHERDTGCQYRAGNTSSTCTLVVTTEYARQPPPHYESRHEFSPPSGPSRDYLPPRTQMPSISPREHPSLRVGLRLPHRRHSPSRTSKILHVAHRFRRGIAKEDESSPAEKQQPQQLASPSGATGVLVPELKRAAQALPAAAVVPNCVVDDGDSDEGVTEMLAGLSNLCGSAAPASQMSDDAPPSCSQVPSPPMSSSGVRSMHPQRDTESLTAVSVLCGRHIVTRNRRLRFRNGNTVASVT
ncbi:unnamed protein product [Peniophora sp. CBMAI 1063]|nr:unnamed protein product [Peniophora sp. CBMAI 1063]